MGLDTLSCLCYYRAGQATPARRPTVTQTDININSAAWRLDQSRPSTVLTLREQVLLLRDAAAEALAAGDCVLAAERKADEMAMRAAL